MSAGALAEADPLISAKTYEILYIVIGVRLKISAE